MPDPVDPITETAKALAKQLPIKHLYKDMVSPAAKETGEILEDIIKTIRLALVPIQIAAAFQDRLRSFIDRAVRRVPEEKRISPAPQILGPVLEGIRYEMADSPINEMFSQLLSRSMDSQRLEEAHPAYPIIIRQLSPDEARLLAALKERPRNYTYFYPRINNESGPRTVELDERPCDELAFPENFDFYIEHLVLLGLAGHRRDPRMVEDENRRVTGHRYTWTYSLSDFGNHFMQACSG